MAGTTVPDDTSRQSRSSSRALSSHDEIDVSTLAFWSLPPDERDQRLSVLRHRRPVSWQRPADGMATLPGRDDPGFWAVLRLADVTTVSRRPDLYCSGRGIMIEDLPEEILEAASSFLATDHPRHTSLRRLVSAGFTPRRVALLEDKIAASAQRLVDEVVAQGSGDFVQALSRPLPALTFAEMMGVPAQERDRICGFANDMVAWNDAEALAGRDGLTLLMETLVSLYGVAAELAAERRASPAEDILGGLVAAEVDGRRLTDEDIAAFFVLLAVAANDTTKQTISYGMQALSSFPDQRNLLASDLSRYLPDAIEEMVRWACPVMTFRRTATVDSELAGQQIRAGDKVVMYYVSANRDEAVFSDPYRFDVTRPVAHVGFGGGGPHFCLGASLARTMLRATFSHLLTRAPTLQVYDAEYLVGNFIQGITTMPYTL